MFDNGLFDRLMARTRQDDSGCLLWTGNWFHERKYAGHRYGYMSVKIDGRWKTKAAHRLVWAAIHGWPTAAQCVCHTCDVPLCVNPEHLYLGTMADNMRDRDERQRNHNSNKTICKRGHPLEGENLYTYNGARHCKRCATGKGRVAAGWPEDLAYSLPTGPCGYQPPGIPKRIYRTGPRGSNKSSAPREGEK